MTASFLRLGALRSSTCVGRDIILDFGGPRVAITVLTDRMIRVRLAPDGAQILVLGVNAASQHEGVREDLSQSPVARNLARDVAHDAAKIGLQRFQRALGAVELFGVRVALLHH